MTPDVPEPTADTCKAPEGYKKCDKKCGLWVPRAFGYCTVCWKAKGYPTVNPECIDWTPPLAAQPAEMPSPVSYHLKCGHRIAEDSPTQGEFAKRGHVANCAKGCNDMLTPTQISDDKPAPQPEPATKCESFQTEGCHGGPYQAHSTECHRRRGIAVPSFKRTQPDPAKLEWSFTDQEGREHRFATGNERDAGSRAYWAWMYAQSGTSYTGPERLARPKLAHSMGLEDPILEDA